MAALAPLTRKRLLGTSYGLGSGSYTSRRKNLGAQSTKGASGSLEIWRLEMEGGMSLNWEAGL